MTGRAALLPVVLLVGCGRLDFDRFDPPTDNPCWSRIDGDVCSDPAPSCGGAGAPLLFVPDQLNISSSSPLPPCATLRVPVTGYYHLFANYPGDSCAAQPDESAYVRIDNSCNPDGWPSQRNAGDYFVILDGDNAAGCDAPGRAFYGTFLLVAGEDNRLCFYRWCEAHRAELERGVDLGFTRTGCELDSIELRAASAGGCLDDTTLHACSWGCIAGVCLPDPCASSACAAFCKDGACLADNPCAGVACAHGCVNGRCLQNRHARGPDADGDGFPALADCDDGNPAVNPDAAETCGNAVDDDCDGLPDGPPCA